MNPSRCVLMDALGNEYPATIDQCVGLEPVAVWEAEHVESRIDDFYAGRSNSFLESIKLILP